jgi:ribosomal-protein-alanine N-acetyltransferase
MLSINFGSFPIIATERLVLRQITNDDVDDVFAFRSNWEAMQYISRPIATTTEDVLKLIAMMNDFYANNKAISWGICFKDTNKVIGTIGYVHIDTDNFRAEIGYMLDPSYHRQSIMQEAIEPVIDWGFNTIQLHSIEATVNPDNIASKNILLKNGFIQEAYFKENFYYEGQFLDTVIFSLLKSKNLIS